MSEDGDIVVVDADAFIAYVDKNDIHAQKTVRILEMCFEREITLLYPATAIIEAVTALQRRLRKPALAQKIIDGVKEQQFIIEPIDQTIIEKASHMFKPSGSKNNTLFDAIVAAVAKENNAVAIFSFDTWYKSQGFSLATDLL